MSKYKRLSFELESLTTRMAIAAGLLLAVAMPPAALASENVPHRPFAYWADLPEEGQFVAGFVYEQSEAYHIWAGRLSLSPRYGRSKRLVPFPVLGYSPSLSLERRDKT